MDIFTKLRDIVNFLKDPNNKNISTKTSRTPSDNGTIIPTGGNSIACDAISNKLTEVADIAESLDSVLRDTQNGLDLTETNSSSSEKKCEPVHNGSIDEWSSSVRSTEDESFLTASDCACTPQSRSSSYQTTSECRASPWWSSNDKSSSEDCSNLSPETSSFHLLNGILSSTNASFDSSDHSFRSAQASPHLIGSTPGKIEKPPEIKTSENEKSKLCNGNAEINDKIDKNNEEQSQVRSSEIKQNGSWSNNYYQNVVPKHVIKGCL